jgi:hypothetical protein
MAGQPIRAPRRTVTVPSAHTGYELGVSGLNGVDGTVTVPVANAGKSISLDDSGTDDQGNSAIEVVSG